MFHSLQEYLTTDVLHFPVYHEKRFAYDLVPLLGDNMKIYGYFQSYQYFEDKFEIINSLLHLAEQRNACFEKFSYRYFKDDNETLYISLHFRLGDYKDLQEYHNILPYEYYENALSHVVNNGKGPYKILYFCEQEDAEYVERIMMRLYTHFHVVYERIDDMIPDFEQLFLMSCCHINIIANSSFSWWGAYLNTYIDKQIYYPSQWFGKALSGHCTNDMFPKENWNKIVVKEYT